jgi:hypothetical protein
MMKNLNSLYDSESSFAHQKRVQHSDGRVPQMHAQRRQPRGIGVLLRFMPLTILSRRQTRAG